jgi:hypothetical protein
LQSVLLELRPDAADDFASTVPSFTILVAAAHALDRLGSSRWSHRKQLLALMTVAAIG